MADHSTRGGRRLREHRLARMMTQHDVAERLDELAWLLHRRRVGVNPDMVSKWERGEKHPSTFYLKLLCALYDVSPAELGFGRPAEPVAGPAMQGLNPPLQPDLLDLIGPGVEVLRASLFSLWREDMLNRRQLLTALGLTPAAIGLSHLEVPLGLGAPSPMPFRGGETITALEDLTPRLESSYHSARPEKLLLPVRALADAAESFLPDAGSARSRSALLRVVSRAQLLAGRLSFFDLHRPMEARSHLDVAREAAIEAEDSLLVSAALGHMAFLPAQHQHLGAATSYLEGARQELGPHGVAQVAGWLDAVESEMQTRAGRYDASRTALRRAHVHLAAAEKDAAPEWFDYFDDTRLAGFEGFMLLSAGECEAARRALERSLAGTAPRFPKQRSVTMLDLASVCAQQGDIEAGCALATDAVVSLRDAGYATAVERLREFNDALPDTKHPAARLLEEAIVDLS